MHEITQELDTDFPTKINLNVIASVLKHFTFSFYRSDVFSPGHVGLPVSHWQSQQLKLTLTLGSMKADSFLHICCQLLLWISF